MRLLHVTHQYRPAIGGAEKYITDLSEELARRGHSVDVYTSGSTDYRSWRSCLPRSERIEGVNVHRFRSLHRVDYVWRVLAFGYKHYWRTGRWWYEPLIFFGNGPVSLGMVFALMRDAGSYDLIHINNLHYSHAFSAYLAARLRRVPYVITPHIHAEQRETYDVGYMRTILRNCDAIFADTRAERAYLSARDWNRNVIVGGTGLRLDDYPLFEQKKARSHLGLPSSGFVMLFLGRKTSYKGLDLCVKAFFSLRRQCKDVHFLAIGPETEFSETLWSHYPQVDELIVRGRVSDEERLMALAACDTLVLPSVGEAFGIVYLEAWAYAKPVIGANIPSVASIVSDGVDGFLVDADEPDELVNRLRLLVEDIALAQTMGMRGREKLKRRYTIEKLADIVEGTCARVLRRRQREVKEI